MARSGMRVWREPVSGLQARWHRGTGEVARLRHLGCRPKQVRREYMPTSYSSVRALGTPSLEDRIVQDCTRLILQAISEPEFRKCSQGFQPGRNAHEALEHLTKIITAKRTQWVVEAAI